MRVEDLLLLVLRLSKFVDNLRIIYHCMTYKSRNFLDLTERVTLHDWNNINHFRELFVGNFNNDFTEMCRLYRVGLSGIPCQCRNFVCEYKRVMLLQCNFLCTGAGLLFSWLLDIFGLLFDLNLMFVTRSHRFFNSWMVFVTHYCSVYVILAWY